MVVEFSFLLSRSISTNQVEGSTLPARVPQPQGSRQFCRMGSRRPARAKRKTRTENKRGAGRRECRVRACRREDRGQENKESGREETTALDLKTRCIRGVTVSAVFWGNPRVEG